MPYSFLSYSSQRISVGTFREAQARRSTAGSPVSYYRVRLSRICLTIAAIVSYRLGYRTANFRPHLARWQQFLPQAAPNPTPSPQPGGVQLNCTPLLFCQHDFWQREQAWASFLTLAPVS